MAQAAVIVGCSSSFKWRQEYIMAAESEVAVRRGRATATQEVIIAQQNGKSSYISTIAKGIHGSSYF